MLYSLFHITQSTSFQSAGIISPVVNYTISIFNATDDGDEDVYATSDTLPPHITSYTFSGVPKGRNYTIELVVTNAIGNSFTVGKNTFLLSPVTYFENKDIYEWFHN